MAKIKTNIVIIFLARKYTKNVTSRFHTMFGSRDTNFRPFFAKSAFLGPNFSRTEIFTAKPMVVDCVQHYSTHFINKLGKSLELFFHKVKQNEKRGKKGEKCQKGAKNADFRLFLQFFHFWFIF